MSKKDVVQNIVFQALKTLNEERGADEQIAINANTSLFGPDSVLDSLSLVSVIVDIETLAADEFGKPITLTDDEAMGRDPVPFVNVGTLTDYILELLAR
jgi:acyl carrier protein